MASLEGRARGHHAASGCHAGAADKGRRLGQQQDVSVGVSFSPPGVSGSSTGVLLNKVIHGDRRDFPGISGQHRMLLQTHCR